jgi:hypothetical protein
MNRDPMYRCLSTFVNVPIEDRIGNEARGNPIRQLVTQSRSVAGEPINLS